MPARLVGTRNYQSPHVNTVKLSWLESLHEHVMFNDYHVLFLATLNVGMLKKNDEASHHVMYNICPFPPEAMVIHHPRNWGSPPRDG